MHCDHYVFASWAVMQRGRVDLPRNHPSCWQLSSDGVPNHSGLVESITYSLRRSIRPFQKGIRIDEFSQPLMEKVG